MDLNAIPCKLVDKDEYCPFKEDWVNAKKSCKNYIPEILVGFGIFTRNGDRLSQGLFPSEDEAKTYLSRNKIIRSSSVCIKPEVVSYIPDQCGFCNWHTDEMFEPECILISTRRGDSSRNIGSRSRPKDCPWHFFKE